MPSKPTNSATKTGKGDKGDQISAKAKSVAGKTSKGAASKVGSSAKAIGKTDQISAKAKSVASKAGKTAKSAASKVGSGAKAVGKTVKKHPITTAAAVGGVAAATAGAVVGKKIYNKRKK